MAGVKDEVGRSLAAPEGCLDSSRRLEHMKMKKWLSGGGEYTLYGPENTLDGTCVAGVKLNLKQFRE